MRGKKKERDYEKEIAQVKEKIKKAEAKVKELNLKLKTIKADQTAEITSALTDAMKDQNLTIKDVIELVKEKKSST